MPVFQIRLSDCTNCSLVLQAIEKNIDMELERLTRISKQQIDQLQAGHTAELKALEKRLKTDQVIFSVVPVHCLYYKGLPCLFDR